MEETDGALENDRERERAVRRGNGGGGLRGALAGKNRGATVERRKREIDSSYE